MQQGWPGDACNQIFFFNFFASGVCLHFLYFLLGGAYILIFLFFSGVHLHFLFFSATAAFFIYLFCRGVSVFFFFFLPGVPAFFYRGACIFNFLAGECLLFLLGMSACFNFLKFLCQSKLYTKF